MTGTGAPIDDKLASMTAGPRGPLLMQVSYLVSLFLGFFVCSRSPDLIFILLDFC